MIIIDIIFSLYSCIIFLPFLTYLFKKKRNKYYYLIYGLLLDLIFLNKYFLTTITLILAYLYFPRRKKYFLFYFIFVFTLIFIINAIIHNNISYIYSSVNIINLIINILFYKSCNNKYIF